MEASDLDWSIVTNLYDEFDQTKIINDSLRLPQLTSDKIFPIKEVTGQTSN